MAFLQTEVISHSRKICSLYKKAARTLQCWTPDRLSFRYEATILRDRFEQNRNLVDSVKLQQVVKDSELELFEKQHYQPIKFPYSPGGVAFGRNLESPDWVLDYWTEDEKARFPEYFAKREQRKKEYITYWESKFGKAEVPAHH